jgi:hypothetical protein
MFVTPEPHLDAETLAAWADESLTAGERAAVEAHAADCVRCQAMLAAMVRTEPAAQPKAAWWRPGSVSRWLIPLATATAAVVLIWVVAFPRPNPPQPQAVAGKDAQAVDRIAEAVPTPEPSAPPPLVARRGADTPKVESRVTRRDESGATLSDAKQKADALELKKSEAMNARVPAPVAAPSAAAETVAPTGRAGAAIGGVLREQAFDKALRNEVMPEIVSSNPASHWRITPTHGLVQHSADGGATWEPQQTGVIADLTAGSSPMPSVCWLVGRGGVVLLSTDARTWRRVPFPEITDLSAVSATDVSAAVVTTADGRKFATADGGATWERVSLQEFPAAPF